MFKLGRPYQILLDSTASDLNFYYNFCKLFFLEEITFLWKFEETKQNLKDNGHISLQINILEISEMTR